MSLLRRNGGAGAEDRANGTGRAPGTNHAPGPGRVNGAHPAAGSVEGGERALVAAAAAGDAPAFEALYDRHVDAVYRFLHMRVGDPWVAEDLTQDVFLGAFRALDGFRGEGSLRAWLLRSAHNRLSNHWRSQSRRPVQVPLGDDDEGDAVAVKDRPVPAADPLAELADRLTSPDVMAALRELSEAQQSVLALRIGLDLSVAETAAVMARTETAVRSLQHSALKAFRRRLIDKDHHP